MKIALYCRVSTLLQFEKGNSIDEQKKRLKAYCESRGWDQYEEFVDAGFSGSNMERPALQELISRIDEFDMVLVYKLDRLGRNQRDILYLIEDVFKDVAFNSITENFDTSTPAGKLMLSMMGAFAELERQQINERMMMGRIASAEKGRWRGGSGVPTGYKYIPVSQGGNNSLVIDEETAPIVRDMFQMMIDGHSFTSINKKYHFSGAGVVRTILENQVYIGKIKYCGKYYDGNHEPIIDEATFNKVQKIIHERDVKRNYPSLTERHLLTGFLRCSCGSRACYHKSQQKNKDGTKRYYEYYECYTRMAHGTMRKAKRCTNKIWRMKDLEETVWDVLSELDYAEVSKPTKESKSKLKSLEKQIKAVEKQISKLVELYSMEDIPMDILTTQLDALNSKKNNLMEQFTLEKQKPSQMSEYEVKQKLSTIEQVRKSDLPTQRAFLGSLIEEITLLPNHDLKFKWKF